MPELAPVTIAFWPLSNLRFSVFGTTGFGRSPKVCACGIFGFGRLIASGGMVGIVIPFVVLRIRRRDERFLTKQTGRELLERRDELALVERHPESPSLAIVRRRTIDRAARPIRSSE